MWAATVFLAALAAIIVSVQSIGECIYEDKFPNRKLLVGDSFAIELNPFSTGNNIKYNFDDGETGVALFSGTFEENGSPSAITGLTGAKNVVNGFQENEFAVLGSGNMVFFLAMDRYNGSLAASKSLTLPAGPSCNNLASSASTGKMFVVCFDSESQNLTLHRIDLYTFDLEVSINISQPAGKILQNNLQLLIDDYQYEQGRASDTLIYIFEGSNGQSAPAFRILKSKDMVLINGGYFSVADQTISGLKGGSLTGVFFDGSKTLFTTRTGTNNYLQWCYRSPVYGVYNCNQQATTLSSGLGLIQIYLQDPTFRVSNQLIVLMTNLTALTYGLVDQSTTDYPYSEVAIMDLTNNSLQSIKSAMPANGDFYIFGPTQADQPSLIDGIIKFDSVSQSYEQYTYPMGGTKLQFVTKNPYDTDLAKLYVFGEELVTYYEVKRNYLLIKTTNLQAQNLSELSINVSCTADSDANNWVVFNLSTLLNVNDNATFRVPELSAYYGQVSVPLPSDGEDIQGNGALVTLGETNATGLVMGVKHNEDIQVVPTDVEPSVTLNTLKYVGDNTYAAVSQNRIRFYKAGISGISMTIAQNAYQLYLANMNFLDTQVDQGQTVSLYSNTQGSLKNLRQAATPTTAIVLKNLNDDTDQGKMFSVKFAATQGLVKFVGKKVYVVVVGGVTSETTQGIYFTIIDLDFIPESVEFTQILPLGTHVCPVDIAWVPRQVSSNDGYSFYISSNCESSGMDSHIYIYETDGTDFSKTQLKNTYQVAGTKNFKMCAQINMINIIDYTNNLVFSFNTSESQQSIYNLPLPEYNLTTILSHSCNPNDAILHVVASGPTGTRMVTYRSDYDTLPQSRVHSLVDIDAKYKFAAGTWSDITDQISVLLVGATTSDLAGKLVYASGPHIYFNIDNVAQAGSYQVNYNLVLPGPTNVTIPISTVLNLEDQFGGIKVSLAGNQKIPANGSLINLENYLLIEGAYHNVEQSASAGLLISDRISQSNQFSNLSIIFSDALFFQNYAFGWGLAEDKTTPVVRLVDAAANTELLAVSGSQLTSIDYIVKNDTHIFFFGLAPGQGTDRDQIIYIFTTDGGKTWKNGILGLFTQGYQMARFRNGPNNLLVLGTYNNQDDFMMQLVGFRIVGNALNVGLPYNVTYFENIAAFDFVVYPTGDIVAIVNNEYIKLAEFIWLRISEDEVAQISELGSYESGLVPNEQISNVNIVFKCRNPQPQDFSIICFTSTANTYSYVSNFTVDFTQEDPTQFVTSVRTVAKLRNIVNLVPIRADFVGSYIAIVVKNVNAPKPKMLAAPISYFSDPYVNLIYNLNVNTKPVQEWEVPIYDVYKCLVSGDLQMKDKSKLGNLVPRLFTDFNNSLKLGINIGFTNGTYTDSVKVFNLNPLAISVPQGSNNAFSLNFFGINDQANPVQGSSIFEASKSDEPAKKSSKKVWIWVIVILLIVILGIVGFGVYLQNKQNALGAEEPVMNEPENTMKDNTSTGNYMKA